MADRNETCPTCGSSHWWVYITPCDGGIHDGWHAPDNHPAVLRGTTAAPTPAPRCPYFSRAWGVQCDRPVGHDGNCQSGGDGFAPGYTPAPNEKMRCSACPEPGSDDRPCDSFVHATPPAPDAEAVREACRVAAKAAAEHVDSSWRAEQDPTSWHPMRLPLVRAACDVGEAAAIRALPPAPVDAVRAERESALAIEPDALVNAIMGSDLVRLYGIKHVEIVRYHARQIARVYRALAAERAAPATGGHDGKGA